MLSKFNEHSEMFEFLLRDIKCVEKYSVLDAGSGKTSLNIITGKFQNSTIDAICYPKDYRKIDSIKVNLTQKNFCLLERDICQYSDWKTYDFVIAHLLLGEAMKFGNDFLTLLNSLILIKGKYLIVIDYPEDPGVDFSQIFDYCYKAGYELISEHIVNKSEIFQGKEFEGHYYKGMLFKLV